MSRHTPGPWSVPHFADAKCQCKCRYVLCDSLAGCVCTVEVDNGKRISDGGNDGPPMDQAIANALLIAAAPDLLAALKAIVGNPSVRMVMQDLHDAGVAAISKAEGPQ